MKKSKQIRLEAMSFMLLGAMIITGASTAAKTVKPATAGAAEPMEEDREKVEDTGENGRNDAFQVRLPACTEEVFDFIMDPQELISKTEAAAYGDCVFEEGATLFFKRSDERRLEDYSSQSDTLEIANMGTTEAEITLTAAVLEETLGGIAMTEDMDFIGDKGPSLYLALTDGSETIPITREGGASIYRTLEGKSGEDGNYGSYWFQLTGAANPNGDWSQVTSASPKVVVTWSVSLKEREETEKAEKSDEESAPAEGGEDSRSGTAPDV